LAERAARLGAYTRERFAALAKEEPGIRGARGLGLLLAVELEPAAFPPAVRGNPASMVVDYCAAESVSTVSKGKDAISFSPPLTISEEEIDLAAAAIARAVARARD
jgi:4-aminobutyrate aminotransferase-like enzyme